MPELMTINNTNKPKPMDDHGQVSSEFLIGEVINLANNVVCALGNWAIEKERTKQCKYNYKIIKEQSRTERLKIQNTYKLYKQKIQQQNNKLEKDFSLLNQLDRHVNSIKDIYLTTLTANPSHSGIESISKIYHQLLEAYIRNLNIFFSNTTDEDGF